MDSSVGRWLRDILPESHDAVNMAEGAAAEMRDAMGNLLVLARDPQRNLQQIKTPSGHWISFTYDGASQNGASRR